MSVSTHVARNFHILSVLMWVGLEIRLLSLHWDMRNLGVITRLYGNNREHRKCIDLKLELLKEHKFRLAYPLQNALENSIFYCYRGLMTCISCTPYENSEPWKIVVILYEGNIYMCARPTDESLKRKYSMTERDKRFLSWGYKFEQFILSDKPDTQPNPYVPVDETEEFSLIFKTKLNKHTIVYGAEMDGIHCGGKSIPLPPKAEGVDAVIQYLATKEFIELKTNRHIEFRRQDENFRRYKTKKWWCQSFLVGIDKILCGFRNDEGIVEKLNTYSIKDLVKISQNYWDPNVCFNFMDTFFTYVKRCLAREVKRKHGEKAVDNLQSLPIVSLLLEWNPGMPVRVAEDYNYEEDPILPEWFLNKNNV
ncbi:decapping and exoribonuclease protein-like isoform X2 [Achroia grisella]|uniref:decapping and exoribonuclease protein-like isoform X2 n=1 Tax=Achroia grisella TaxID=688607 RepID=UPI0027D227D4|nr:decapping and exoribonuclease protein-like isoform X2 [Achroia grisella]